MSLEATPKPTFTAQTVPKKSPMPVSPWPPERPAQDYDAIPRPDGIEFERHLKVNEIAQMWGCSRETIRRLFQDEPGVVRIGHEETRFRRRYTCLRIPESVMRSVHRRLRQRTRRSA